ncbi:MAG: carboxylating nicotinate-nucleotide diphosphorylase [Methylobacillus sp.]|nr:carboxylating nicotinate-nucleotide diphosphorylase [Methylobacillus sp.]
MHPNLLSDIECQVRLALAEDMGAGDITAQLIPAHMQAVACVISREEAVLCGAAWFEMCFRLLDPDARVTWLAQEGDRVQSDQTLCEIHGNARALLSAERCALNFLQTLSAVATVTRKYVDAIAGTHAVIMDTRKTLPGLRLAQKYAVTVGGGKNQRIGLFDGVLIKENHIAAAGGIAAALNAVKEIIEPPFDAAAYGKYANAAQALANLSVQIEVESLVELQTALDAGAKLILLDNFTQEQLRDAVRLTAGRAELEASGNVTLATVRAIAETGVQRISVGSLTKNIQAVDLSMRIETG